jgi:hypothetical protein
MHACLQYPKRHLLALLVTMSVVLLASLVAHFLVTCGTWQVRPLGVAYISHVL